MITLPRTFRLWTILRVLIRHHLDEIFFDIPFLRPISFLYRLLPWNWFSKQDHRPRAERIRLALEELGPVYIKFGQMLSTRRDLLPDEFINQLAKLQDNVPPFPSDEAKAVIEQAYEKPISEIFASFESEPLASASIAQVHAAKLWSGEDVIVKVLRPHIEKTIRQDIELMYILARLAQKYWQDGKRLRPVEVVHEYEKNIFDELDMQREAANASQLHRNFENSKDLYVPKIYWPYVRLNVLVMERIYGTPIGDIPRLQDLNINFKRLGERGVEIFFTQVFRHNFFHADMHPGNIFVEEHNPDDPRYIAVDFGIVGTLSPEDQRYLAENFHAFFNRDYKRVAELHVESGWVPADTRVDEFESAIRSVCEPIFQQPIKDISFGNLLLRLFQTARRFNMEVQPQLVLLQKTLLNIEGLGRQLYPDLDLWTTAKPFIQRWMDEQVGVRALFKGAQYNIPKILEQAPYMPSLIHDIARQAHQSQLKMQWESKQITQLQQEIKQGQYANRLAIIGATLLIVAGLVSNDNFLGFFNEVQLTWLLGGVGAGFLIASLLKR